MTISTTTIKNSYSGNGSTTTVAAEEDKTSKKIDAAFDGLLGGKGKDIDFK